MMQSSYIYAKCKPCKMEFQKTLSLKEFAGSFASLVCYSRIGAYNMLYAGGVNLGMVLFVFGFPFLNPYLSTFMYFGPFWSSGDVPAILLSWIVAVCAQVAGACTAGTMHNYLVSQYGSERLEGIYTYGEATAPAATCIADEMFAVVFLLVGLLHLMHSLTDGILVNRFWDRTQTAAVSHQPLSVPLIVCAVFLVVAITQTFPSANQSLHITIFLSVIGVQAGDVCAYRSLGGFLGTLLALGYYHVYYNNERWFANGYSRVHGDVVESDKPTEHNQRDNTAAKEIPPEPDRTEYIPNAKSTTKRPQSAPEPRRTKPADSSSPNPKPLDIPDDLDGVIHEPHVASRLSTSQFFKRGY